MDTENKTRTKKEKLLGSLKRQKARFRRVQKMIDEDKECIECHHTIGAPLAPSIDRG